MATLIQDAAEVASESFTNLKNIACDLLTIEVNTIIKDNMTTGRMPSPPNALLDISYGYIRTFERMRIDIHEVFRECKKGWEEVKTFWDRNQKYECGSDGEDLWDINCKPPILKAGAREEYDHGIMSRVTRQANVTVGGVDQPEKEYFRLPGEPISFPKVFELLRWSARRSIKQIGHELNQEQRVLLQRIELNCDTLRTLLRRYPDIANNDVTMAAVRAGENIFPAGKKFTPQDITTLRKIWDIGCETVLAQTVVQLDGDIITRVASRFREIAGGDEEAREMLSLHQECLSTALGRWDNMVKAAKSVIEGIAGFGK